VSRIAKCVDDTVALWHQNNQPKFTEFYLDCVKRCIACSNEAVAALLCKFVAKSAAAISKEQRGIAAAASAVERETLADLVASKLLELVDSRSNVVRQHCCHVLMQLVLELPPEIELEYVHTALSLALSSVARIPSTDDDTQRAPPRDGVPRHVGALERLKGWRA